MAAPRRTQKQIAERYKGNLGYYRRKHGWRRARYWISFLAIVGGIAAILLFQTRGRETFFNPGKISSSHARFADDCAQCHDKSLIRSGTLTPSTFKAVLRDRFSHGVAFDPIDRKCEACHLKQDRRTHTFHEANVVQDRSCSACHQEHQGPGPLRLVANSNCISCHGNTEIMQASAQKGMQLSPQAFHRHPVPSQQVVFELPRPSRGYTQTFSSFWNGHPEFQLEREKVRDPDYDWKGNRDILRFNHQRHLAPDIPWVNGKKLDCNYCHKPDAEGRYYQRITFAANCQACRSLQFDAKNADMKIPHGDVALADLFAHLAGAIWRLRATEKRKDAGQRGSKICFAAHQAIARAISHGRRIGAGRVLHERSLQTAAANGPCDARELRRLRFLPRSEAAGERSTGHHQTDFGRSLDAASAIRSRQARQREMR